MISTSAARAEDDSADLLVTAVQPSAGAFVDKKSDETKESSEAKDHWIRYGSKGLELKSEGGSFTARVNFRSQLRFSAPFESVPRTPEQFDAAGENEFGFRRARFKMEGQLGREWIEYKYEQDLLEGKVLDLRFDIGPEWLKLRVGQWKADYSRERSDSSGKLQFADRSIVNRAYTLDRQKGAMAVGRLAKDSILDSQYYAGIFSGQGRGMFRPSRLPQKVNDGGPLWILRYQWNPLGGGVAFSESDLERLDTPRLSLAVSTARNRSSYTRFSSSGGGQLDGFLPGLPGQYAMGQKLAEVAFKRSGLSIQHEFHWKRVTDTVNSRQTQMRGSYIQGGYFFNEIYSRFPKQLELAARFAFVDPNIQRSGDTLRETTIAANWFFKGHSDKLTFDVSRYTLVEANGLRRNALGVRTQWDVTF